MKIFFTKLCCTLLLSFSTIVVSAQQVDFSVVSVPEEAGLDFLQLTNASDYVCLPIVERTKNSISWFSNRILDTSVDGQKIAFLSNRNNTTNIFIKDLNKQGSSIQRTNRSAIIDFSYSPDGKSICFSESRGNSNQLFQTDANNGYICRQITSGNMDYSPIYSKDMTSIFFARQETNGVSIWNYNVKNNFLSSLSVGLNPYPVSNETSYVCVRMNSIGKSEIWKINYETGVEECIVSDPNKSFTTPSISPDGEWILFVGESAISTGSFTYYNTDIYAVRKDGTGFTQLTYHAADELSPVWSRDGKYIYFISQRGSANGTANVWRMTFNY